MKQKKNKLTKSKTKQKSSFSFHENKTIFWIGAIIISIIFWAVYSTTFDPKVYGLIGDNLGYYTMGRSIADGDIWIYNNGSPSNHFPPGWPLIIGITMLVSGGSIFAIKAAEGLMLFASILIMYGLSWKITKNVFIGLALGILLATNGNLLYYGTIMMSEVPATFFITLTMLCFYHLMKYISQDEIQNKHLYLLILATGISAGWSQQIRSMSIFLPMGIIFTLMISIFYRHLKNKKIEEKKEIKPMLSALIGFMLVFIVCVVPWSIRDKVFGLQSGYNPNFEHCGYIYTLTHRYDHTPIDMTDVGFWVDKIWNNAGIYISRGFPRTLAVTFMEDKAKEWNPQINDYLIGWTFVLLSILGLISLWKKNKYFTLLIISMAAVDISILSVWLEGAFAGQHAVRYTVPFAPILLFLTLNGIAAIAQFITYLMKRFTPPNSWQVAIYQGLTAIFLCCFLLILKPTYSSAIAKLQADAAIPGAMITDDFPGFALQGLGQMVDLGAAFVWCHTNLPNERIMVRPFHIWDIWPHDPPYIFYPPNNSTADEALDYLIKHNVKYFILDTWMARSYATMGPCINKYSDKFKILYKKEKNQEGIEDTYVFEFNNDWGYTGEKDKNGNAKGKGKLVMNDGRVYSGEFDNGSANGYGVMLDSNGTEIAKGMWKDGTLIK